VIVEITVYYCKHIDYSFILELIDRWLCVSRWQGAELRRMRAWRKGVESGGEPRLLS